jgi:hypothetical protein
VAYPQTLAASGMKEEMKKTIYILILIGLCACNDEANPILIQKKWQIVDTYPLVEGSIYVDGLKSLDLSKLSQSKTDTSNMYYQKIGERRLIRFTNSKSYFEVLKLTEDHLEIGLYNHNPNAEEEKMMVKMKFQSVDE